jgi:ring-1,2-phenylacetyl-CoA epoxidase subunit PaaE
MVAPPAGRFTYVKSGKGQQIVAFAAGSGITPIMSIIKTALKDNESTSVYLVYGNKTLEDTLFYKELKALEEEFSLRLKVKWVFSRANVAESLFGRIDGAVVKNTLNQLEGDTDKFYLCGPEAMIRTVSKTLEKKGISSSKILFELFTASADGSERVSQSTSATLEIIYDDINYKLDAQEGKSILDTALDNNLDVPYSCQGGVCSSCIARIKSGKAEMQMNQILTDEEVKEGLILTCQAHPTSNELKVDYDDV